MNKKISIEEKRATQFQKLQVFTEIYGEDIYQDIIKILWDHDPIRLHSSPRKHEYEPEARTITPRLLEASYEQELHKIIYEEFVRWFGSSVQSEDDYIKIAHDIWQTWQFRKSQRSL